ncbi:MAG: GNAT family N-acetyltransferase [Fimbriimonadales bacterium]|nr:GNAT family N-acetyltransferase [Fimbriimonadales bacterium]
MTPETAPSLENLVETYLALALALEGTEVRRWRGGAAARNPAELPSTSFVISWSASAGWYDEARRQFGGWTPKLCYRVGPATGAEDELWQAQSLEMMESRGVDPNEPFTLLEDTLPSQREAAAAFMAEAFFAGQPSERREAIERATARAVRCRLYSLFESGRRIGAVMLHQTPSAMGLYNLCVAPPRRGRGLGAAIVRQVQSDACRAGLPVVLQCREELAPWYRRLGFRTVCRLDVLVPCER